MDIDLVKTQQYLEWLKEKLYLNHIASSAKKRLVYRGEVYRCKFGVGIGSEECKERPCVILQYDSANRTSPNTLVAPISHTKSTIPVVVPIETQMDSSGKILLDGNALLGNITCVNKARLGERITKLSNKDMYAIDKAIAMSLGILHHYETTKRQYNDLLEYSEKMQSKASILQNILDTYHFADSDSLVTFLEKNHKA